MICRTIFKRARGAAACALCVFIPAVSSAGAEIFLFEDPAREKRYQTLSRELRCMVCQNQTLAESNAPLAADMRAIVAEMVRGGAGDDEIAAFMTARYGDFIRYRPPLKWQTAALWFAPFALALFALFFIVPTFFRRRARAADDARLQKAARILENEK